LSNLYEATALVRARNNGQASIWIIDPHPLLRSGLKSQLEANGFRVVAEGASLHEAMSKGAEGPAPELVVLDFDAGPCAVKELKTLHPDANAIIFSENAEISNLSRMFAAGADGYILKSISASALVESLKLAMLGEKVFPRVLTGFLGSLPLGSKRADPQTLRVGDVDLSQRELGVVRGLACGQTNKCIAKGLNVTEATVKVHIKTVLRKLGATNRTQVAIWAIQHHVAPDAADAAPDRPATQLQSR
jgi:two-component system nitrate/nitrite response regulator NarL